jgi:hypothetical protein
MILVKQDKFKWHKVFVMFPVDTICGKLVFLQNVYRKWDLELGGWGDSSGYAGTDGGWRYKL